MRIEVQMELKHSPTPEVFGVYRESLIVASALTDWGMSFPETYEEAAILATARENCCVARAILRERASSDFSHPYQHLASPKLRDRLDGRRQKNF